MDINEERYYENFSDLFLTDGWQQLQNLLATKIQQFTIEGLKDSKELHTAQGQLDALKFVFNLPESVKAQREYLQQQEQQQTELEDA